MKDKKVTNTQLQKKKKKKKKERKKKLTAKREASMNFAAIEFSKAQKKSQSEIILNYHNGKSSSWKINF